MTIPLAFIAHQLHASVATFLLSVAVGCLIDWHLDYLAHTEPERC